MRPDAVQIRVLGALLEKQRTTPDAYPLTLNALRAACNQSTNRDPVVAYEEPAIRRALEELGRRRWTRSASGPGSRAPKYRHLLADTLQVEPAQQAILAVLMLRGPQTPGELRARTERLHRFAGQDEVDAVLGGLIERGLVERLERRPGQKEVRYRQLLGGEEDAGGASLIGGAAQPGASGGSPVGAPGASGAPAGSGAPAAPDRPASGAAASSVGAGGAGAARPAAEPTSGRPVAGGAAPPGGGPVVAAPQPVTAAPTAALESEIVVLRGRVEALESEVSRLRAAFARLKDDLGA